MEPAPLDPAALSSVLGPGTGRMLPAEAYTSAAVLAWERRHLFAGTWLCVGRASELAEVGRRRAVAVGDDAVLLVRDGDGAVRGFFNVCRHRGHELQACGTSVRRDAIHCPYHAWTYDLDGALRATPRYEAPAGFEPAAHGLVPVAVEEWRGWLLVDVSGTAGPLADHLGDLDGELARWAPERLAIGATHRYEVSANWKLLVENYHECFHCPAIHPELCLVSPPDSANGHNSSGHRGRYVGGWMDLADGAETMSLDGASGGVVLPGLDEDWRRRVHYLGVLPNLIISPHPDYVMTHRLDPVAPDRTVVECQWLFDPEALARPDFDAGYASDFWDLVNHQDAAACEGVQRGIGSRGYRPGPFGEDEDATAQFVRAVALAYVEGGWPERVPFA